MLAATLQIVAHTAAKSLLFTSSARLQTADGSDNLDQLRGTVRSRPWDRVHDGQRQRAVSLKDLTPRRTSATART